MVGDAPLPFMGRATDKGRNDGEWVALIFSGTVAVSDLKLFVGFAAELVRLVRAARATRAAE